jgi:hypothetical protein
MSAPRKILVLPIITKRLHDFLASVVLVPSCPKSGVFVVPRVVSF